MPPPENPSAWLETFADLDPGLPLLLLPVRIETRYRPDGAPTELLVRLFPDTIHADGHAITPSASEQDLGRAFWERTWRASGDSAGENAAFAWLAGALGPWRAAFVAGAMTPGTPAARRTPRSPTTGRCGLRRSSRRRADPRSPEPTRARLLPERFAVVAYANEASWGPYWGARIPADLAMAPGRPSSTPSQAGARGRWLDARAWPGRTTSPRPSGSASACGSTSPPR